MKFLMVIVCITQWANMAQANLTFDQWTEESISRCLNTPPSGPSLTLEGYRFGMTTVELRNSFVRTYNVSKRLPGYAFYDESQESFVTRLDSGEPIRLSPYFIYAIKGQIESALSRGLADYISVTDMGVARFYIPLDQWQTIEERYPNVIEDRAKIYEAIASNRDTKVFYPTAMRFQLKKRDGDMRLRFRQVNRNLIADNFGQIIDVVYNLEDPSNTLWEIEGYKRYTQAFTISANKNGCFAYFHNGKKYYFDITFSNLKDPRANVETTPWQ